MTSTYNVRIKQFTALTPPTVLTAELPATGHIVNHVNHHRQQTVDIVHGRDDRLLVIVGPCSIHDPQAALEYARRLQRCAEDLASELHIIMRVYFEKPRTTVGWKGLINDPKLDGSFAINEGLRIARQLLLDINHLGLATGSEFLDTIIPQYISDLTTWSAIGARTAESQIHRELASGLSMPLGFKNGTTGNVQVAVDAVLAAQHPHHFLGVSQDGNAAIVSTLGNHDCHIILRGAHHQTNYDAESITAALTLLRQVNLPPHIMVDCSHGNSQKDHERQKTVITDLCSQIAGGRSAIMGIMIESHLLAGKQTLQPPRPLRYGQSITDACISWEDTVSVLHALTTATKQRRQQRKVMSQ